MRVLCLVISSSFPAAAFAAETITYTYDGRGRVVQVDHSGTANAGVSATYSYDDADNRTNVTVSGAALSAVQTSIDDVDLARGAPPDPILPEF